MNFQHRISAVFVLVLGATAFALPPNTLSPAEQKANWILLFDGVNQNTNWRNGITGNSTTWIVDSGSLASAPGSGGSEIYTKNAYSNFEFTAEWKLNLKGNSGIWFRVPTSPSRICASSEYAILDDANGDDRVAMGYLPGETTIPIKITGDNYDLYVTKKDGNVDSPYVHIAKPYAQWNSGVIWAEGLNIENWLNGQKVVEYTLGSANWLQRFGFSKYYNMCPNDRNTWARHPSGLIGMQDHGGGLRVWFRNLKVRPFTPGEKLVSPLITPNGGTFSGTVRVAIEAAITGSTIRYTTDGSDPTASSPIYTDTLTLSATTTVKARTFRNRFGTSDAVSALFTKAGTSVKGDLSPAPRASFSASPGKLLIRNANGEAFSLALYAPDGSLRALIHMAQGHREAAVEGLKPGLYLAKMRRGAWTQSLKIALP